MLEGIEVEVYRHSAPTEYVDTLEARIKPTYLAELGGNGGGAISISINDPKIVDDPTLIDYRNVLKIKVDGLVIGAFLIARKKSLTITDSEKVGEAYELSGESLKIWFDDADVKPFGGLKKQSQETRAFSWASERGAWYKSSDWVTPKVVKIFGDGLWYNHKIDKWPEDSRQASRWIWGADYNGEGSAPDNGICLFRYEFTIATAGSYCFYLAADDYVDMFVDGAQVLTTDGKTSALKSATRVEFDLSAGAHVIALKVQNMVLGSGNPAALVGAFYRVIGNGKETFIGATGTAAGWTVMPYPAVIPGWATGEVLLTLLNEAEARGVLFPTRLTPTFTSTLDSEGIAWPKQDWAFDIGESLLSVVGKLEELGCNVWIDPSNYELNVTQQRGVDRSIFVYDVDGITAISTPVVFEQGKNLRKAESEGVGKIKNSLTIKTEDGWIIRDDTGSVGTYGVIESLLDTGASEGISSTLAGIIFLQRATAEEGATYDIISTDSIPFRDFNEGDWVLAPDERNLLVKRKIMSISLSESDSGRPLYALEFDTIFQDNEARMSKILSKSGGGGLGGSFNNASGTPSSVNGPLVIGSGNAPYKEPIQPTGMTATSTGQWSANGVTAFSEVTVGWNPVTENSDGSITIPVLYEVWGQIKSAVDNGYQLYATSPSNQAIIRPFNTGEIWMFKARAKNEDGVFSNFSATLDHTMVGPAVPLAAPDIPVVTSDKGILIVAWSGKLATLTPLPQFRYVFAEVAVGAGAYTRMGAVLNRDGRNIYIAGLAVGTAYKVRLTAVDGVGLNSAASAIATHTLAGINLGTLEADVAAAITAAQNAATAAQTTANGATTAASNALTQANTATTNAATAQSAATTAQTAANTASTAAATAQTQANTATTNAATAQTKANLADSNALAASGLAATKGKVLYQTSAPTGVDANAQTLWIDTTGGANTPKKWVSGTTWAAVTDKAATDAAAAAATANTAAATAQTQANTATTNAATAQAQANTATTNAATAQTKADSAFANAATAQTAATAAQGTANTALGNAATAQTAANTAKSTADTAVTNAATAQTQANTATTNAATAQTKANTADSNALAASGLAATKGKVLYQTSAPTGVDANLQTLWINTTSNLNTPMKWVSGTTWVAVTDKVATDAASSAASANTAAATAQTQANTATTNAATAQTQANTAVTAAATAQTQANLALANAATAQQKAVDAFNNAATAQGTANSALSTANGKNKIIFSTAVASGTAYVAGDIWFQKTGTVITGQWEFVAGAWASRTIDNAVIANINAGKITAGTLDVARLGAKTITVDKLLVGDFANYFPDPEFLAPNGYAPWTRVVTAGVAGLEKLGTGTQHGAYFTEMYVQEGGTYLIKATRTNLVGSGGQTVLYLQKYDGVSWSYWTQGLILVEPGDGLSTFTVPAGIQKIQLGFYTEATVPAPNKVRISDVTIQRMATGELIVDGAIIADKLAAASVVAGKLAVGSVIADNIQGGAVTAGKVAAGAITANEILAGTITGNELSVGAIETHHLSAGVGGELDISANSSVSLLVGQVEAVTSDAISTANNLEEMQTYYKFGPAGAEVSTPSSPFALALRNDRIEMLENGNVVSYWNAGQMYVSQLIGEKVILGNHQIEKYSTGTVVRAL